MKNNFSKGESLLQKSAALAEAVERIAEGMLVLTKDFQIAFANKKAAEIMEFDPDLVLDHDIRNGLPEMADQPFFAACQKAMQEQRPQSIEDHSTNAHWLLEYNIYPSETGLTVLVRKIKPAEKEFTDFTDRAFQLQNLSSNLGDLMIYQMIREFDGSRRFTFVSDSVELLTGKKPAEILKNAKILADIIAEEDRPFFYEAQQASYRDMSVLDIEVRFKAVGGEMRWVRIWSTPHRLPDGRIVKDGFYTDITERKRAEEALHQTEQRYRSLVDQASDAIMISDLSGNFIDVNLSMCSWFGYTREELLKMNISSLIDPEQLKNDPIDFTSLAQGASVLRERRMMHRNGTITVVEANVKMLPDRRVLAIARDITERKKAADLIRKEKDLFESIINSLPGIFYLRAYPGKVLRWNKQTEVILGYSAEELPELGELHFYDEKDKAYLRQKIAEVYQNGKATAEVTAVRKDGTKFPLHITGVAVQYEGMPCIISTGFDISESKKTEQELQRMNEQLRHLSAHLQDIREEERTSIAREIHDELGQQLTGLKMDIAWLRKKLKNVDNHLFEKLSAMNELVDQTVGSVRRISSQLRPSVLDDLGLVDALEWQSVEFENRFGIQTDFLSGVPELDFPPHISTGLFRIYQESLTNVARHSGAKKVQTTLQLSDDVLILNVSDDGCGFDVESIVEKKTFGLLGIKERTLKLGGKYEIVTKPEKGTSITVSIPSVEKI
jgi:PAS domain S-box-containing protein